MNITLLAHQCCNRESMYSISNKVVRYSRCCPTLEEQYGDASGKPLYSLLPNMRNEESSFNFPEAEGLGHRKTWTALASGQKSKLRLIINVYNNKEVSLVVSAAPTEFNLDAEESISFPAAFRQSFQAQPREQALLFQYESYRGSVISAYFECRLVYEALERFGLISPWHRPIDFDCGMDWPDKNLLDSGDNNKTSSPISKDSKIATVPETVFISPQLKNFSLPDVGFPEDKSSISKKEMLIDGSRHEFQWYSEGNNRLEYTNSCTRVTFEKQDTEILTSAKTNIGQDITFSDENDCDFTFLKAVSYDVPPP